MRVIASLVGWVAAASVATGGLAGCDSEPGTVETAHRPDHCHGYYKEIATAATVAELKRELLELPRVHRVRILRGQAEEGKVPVALLNRKPRTVMSLDMWQLEDGSWTAQQSFACM